MLNLTLKNKQFELAFSGVCVIQTNNCFRFEKNLKLELEQNTIQIESNHYKQPIFISELTKISELLNFSAKGHLLTLVQSRYNLNGLVNSTLVEQIIQETNQYLGIDFIRSKEDINKQVCNCFDLNDNYFINQEILIKLLPLIQKSEKQLVILNSIENLEINKLLSFLNYFDFVLITNDFTNYIKHENQLELVSFYNAKNNDFLTIKDKDVLLSYLEKHINEEITSTVLNSFLKGERTLTNTKIWYFLQEIS